MMMVEIKMVLLMMMLIMTMTMLGVDLSFPLTMVFLPSATGQASSPAAQSKKSNIR